MITFQSENDLEEKGELDGLLRSPSPTASVSESLPPPYDDGLSDHEYRQSHPGGCWHFFQGLASTALFLAVLTFFSSLLQADTGVKPDLSFLHYSKQCPDLSPIGLTEYQNRRKLLGDILEKDGQWGAWVSEPSPNTLYYTNLTTENWYLSERPWLVAITPSHLTVLTPSFELSRSQRLPFAVESPDEIDWITWEEAEDPYAVLLNHLNTLRTDNGKKSDWTIELEENVREFVGAGLTAAGEDLSAKDDSGNVNVRFAKLEVREQRMRKTENELRIQRCAARVTVKAIREVRKQLRVGMTELEGESLVREALTAAGLHSLDIISLFGSNAALPHASASASKKLAPGEFALFDCGGVLMGYESDFTRTVLPDPPKGTLGWKEVFGCQKTMKGGGTWPSERAKAVWETVRRAQEAALDALVQKEKNETVYAANVDRAARKVIEEEGWGKYFSHRLGHGIGLQVHEHPYLNSGNFQPLVEGETFSNEPGIYIESKVDTEGNGIGVRLEDMVLKTEFGWELLSGESLARSPWDP